MAKKKKEPTAAEAEAAKQKIIDELMEATQKTYGDESISTGGGRHSIPSQILDVIPTGSLALNDAIGVGGWPRGRVVEIYGMESSGKTTLTLHAIAEAQKMGGIAAFIDAEHALDIDYARALGVNTDDLMISQPDNGEQALNLLESLVKSNRLAVIVVDSVSALVPKKELEGEMGDHHPGAQARLMSQALRKLTGVVSHSGCTVIFINQIRMKIGVMFGSPKTTSGGQALKFYSSVRAEVTRTGSLKQGEEVYANKTKVKLVKNKVSAPFKVCEFDIIFGEGISWAGEILDFAVELKLLRKSGAWFKYKDANVACGRAACLDWLKESPEVVADLREAIRAYKEAVNA